ncbi:hypothetical protein CDD83_5424 [Cordyceps sp. RAO-2017]|nr:hypothetical protein CDD83_5424 [Cordyceps sp. RAO-2017]
MLPFLKQGLFSRKLVVQGQETTTTTTKSTSWPFRARGYYDLTPPSEISEPEAESGDAAGAPSPAAAQVGHDEAPLVAVVGVGYVGEHAHGGCV